MINYFKLLIFLCGFYSLKSFGQVNKNQNFYTFKQGWEVKKNYSYKGKIVLENVKKDKKFPLFDMKLGYKIYPLNYKNNILKTKIENLSTKKQQTVTVDVSKGITVSGKASSIFSLFNGIWPNKPVKIGDKWVQTAQEAGQFTHFFEGKSITWTYLFKSIEQIQKIPCAKIEIKINTNPQTKSEGFGVAWIDLKDGLINQLDLNLTHALSKPSSNGVTNHLMKAAVQRTK